MQNTRFLSVVIGISILVGSQFAFAVGDAGCGLGSLIIQKNTKLSQCFAATTNATLLNQYFGITSGTSNCSANGFAFQEKKATMFADTNMQSLKVEMARGQGESLTAFAQLLGCQDDSVSAFGKMTRAKYETIFPDSGINSGQMVHSVENEILRDRVLAKGCLNRI